VEDWALVDVEDWALVDVEDWALVDVEDWALVDVEDWALVDAEDWALVDVEGWAPAEAKGQVRVDAEVWALVGNDWVRVEAKREADRNSCLNNAGSWSVWYLTRLIGARFVPRCCASSSSVGSSGAIGDRLRFPGPSLSS